MFVLTVIFTLVTAAVFVAAGLSKVQGVKQQQEIAAHLGVPWDRYRQIGIAELVGAAALVVGLWAGWLGVLAALALLVLMIGAVVLHSRAHDSAQRMLPAVGVGVLTLVTLLLRVATN
ncbi:DoxX family protein [Actinomadura flavalba]|uniref:DoxX family protein n=1 Tax=Actinomadura flavalba TaxID=1120938 RepID=UPI000375AF45|nr:DoxX family protein [Actinomadura flavalba]